MPFTVVTDWLQGALLGTDSVPSGTADWQELGKYPKWRLLPRADEHRADDAERRASRWRWPAASRRDDDQDVDMIPLIDVSLVLLISS